MPKNYEDLKNKVAVVRGLVKTVQIDIMDGIFVRGKTWPFDSAQGKPFSEMENTDSKFQSILREEEGLPFWEEMEYELDLMVSRAHDNFDLFLKLGAKRIIFHLEAEVDPNFEGGQGGIEEFKEFLEAIDLYIRDNTQIGVAINTTTPVANLARIINNIDFVQLMGIEKIGYQGEPFDERVLSQIKALRNEYPEVTISIDGAVNFETASKLIKAGVNRLVVGSTIWNSVNIADTVKDLEDLE